MNRTAFAAVGILIFLCAPLHAQVPQLLNYQGRVVVGSTNFNGIGQFKFALVNSTGSTTYWSNDGTSSGGSQPTAAVSLNVANGLYSVLLGDTGLTNMTAVPATVFDNSDVRLRVWFNDGTHGSQQLSPDQRIGAVGYAARANSSTLVAGQRVLRGRISGTGVIKDGTGFSVTFLPTGSNGTNLPGTVNVTNNSPTVSASSGNPQFLTQVQEGTYVMIASVFYRVDSIQSDTSLTLTQNYSGSTASNVPITKGMTLVPVYTVTFDTPFVSNPGITLTTRNQSVQTGGDDLGTQVISLNSMAGSNSSFIANIQDADAGPYMPGPNVTWDFIVVGQ
ncbi:MAG: hypothetical protein ACXWBP_09500 [Limisphaerales bacterium]